MTAIATTLPPSHGRFGLAAHGLPAAIAGASLAGILLAISYSLHPLWWAAWLAPVFLLCAAAGGAKRIILTSVIAGAAATAGVADYYLGFGGPTTVLIVILLRSIFLMTALGLSQFAAKRLPLGVAMLVLPAVLAGFEQLMLATSVNGAAGSLAYSQMDMPALVQVAALGGVPAVIFLILLPGTLIGLLLSQRWSAGQCVGAVAAIVMLGLAVALFSAAHMRRSPGTVAATMIATDRFDGIPRDWNRVWSVYAPAVRAQAIRGGLVVLPEKIALLDPAAAAQAARDVAGAARATGSTLVVGLEVHDRVYRNRALIATPAGAILWYDKQRMVPYFEDRDVPGVTPLIAAIAGTPLGVAICKDMHIPSIGREYAARTGLMAIPAWDFGRDGWMGARMTAMRAVESGYAIARASRNGLVGAYDASGRVIAESRSNGGVAVTHAMVPTEMRGTFYGRIGDLFGWACLTTTMLLIGWSIVALARRRMA